MVGSIDGNTSWTEGKGRTTTITLADSKLLPCMALKASPVHGDTGITEAHERSARRPPCRSIGLQYRLVCCCSFYCCCFCCNSGRATATPATEDEKTHSLFPHVRPPAGESWQGENGSRFSPPLSSTPSTGRRCGVERQMLSLIHI